MNGSNGHYRGGGESHRSHRRSENQRVSHNNNNTSTSRSHRTQNGSYRNSKRDYPSSTNQNGGRARSSHSHQQQQQHHAQFVDPSSPEVKAPRAQQHHPAAGMDSTYDFEDYHTPQRRGDGRYTYGQDSRRTSAHSSRLIQSASQFRVRIHRCRDAFMDLELAKRPAPSTYIAVHTTTERGHSGLVERNYNPVFNDEFLFTSMNPNRDAIVFTLVAVSDSGRRDKKVAECVLSMQNLMRGVEREMWVSLVRHPGTESAYERGEMLVSILSDDYGAPSLPSASVEETYYREVHDILSKHSPEDLHRLDWYVGRVIPEGPAGLTKLRQKFTARKPVPVSMRLIVRDVTSLSAPDGRPTQAETCYVVVCVNGRNDFMTRTVPYNRRALFDEAFKLHLNSETDVVTVAAFSADRKLGEAQIGLTNLRAGVPKPLSLMLVRSAETGDASNGGRINLSLQTEGYNSPYLMSSQQEERLRQRVLAYLWSHLRDDLHRLDVIVAGIDDADAYMREWTRSIGPEVAPKTLSLCVRKCINAIPKTNGDSVNLNRYHMRVSVGPYSYETETVDARGSSLAFRHALDLSIYDPRRDSIELMLIMETPSKEREVSRVVIGAHALEKGKTVVRTFHLVANALTSSAHMQGEVEVEMVSQDYGLSPNKVLTESRSQYYREKLEALLLVNAPQELHRVPYMVDTAPGGDHERLLADKSAAYGSDIVTAPLTVRILGIRDFRPKCDCYVKVYHNGEAILRTADQIGGATVKFDIGDQNESTIRMTNPSSATLHFKIGQHRLCRSTLVIARTDMSLRTMVRGEQNTVWIPIFEGSADNMPKKNHSDSSSSPKQQQENAVFTGNVMPSAANVSSSRTTSPIGMLGVMVQSLAFSGNTVTTYKLDNGDTNKTASEAVTRDVTTLLSKYHPQDLPKVQPMIAGCTSIKQAHHELKEKYCPKPGAATVYLHIDKIDMIGADAQVQEEQCGIVVTASFGDESQQSYKKCEFENDVRHERVIYTPLRLDLADTSRGSASHRAGMPLEIKLTSMKGSMRLNNPGDAPRLSTSQQPPTPNAPNISTSKSPSRARGENGLAAPQSTSIYNSGTFNTSSSAVNRNIRDDGMETSPRRRLGGANQLENYIDPDLVQQVAINHHHQSNSGSDKMHTHNSGFGFSPSPARSYREPQQTSTMYAYQSEIGFVQLSLHALLTSPLYRLGDTVRVPVMRPPSSQSQRHIVGHLTLRVTTAAFEIIPEWLRLASRNTLSEVDPRYVHYYEKRIGAFMRERCPTDLVDFHYKLYEHHVASGQWPVSLAEWLSSLEKTYGPESSNPCGPVPRLRFDPDKRTTLLLQAREFGSAGRSRGDEAHHHHHASSQRRARQQQPERSPQRSAGRQTRRMMEPTYAY